MLQPGFWNDQQKAQRVINESNALKDQVNEFHELFESYENLDLTYELVKEENDAELQSDLEEELTELTTRLKQYELQLLLSEPYDKNNAILRASSRSRWNRVTGLGLYATAYVYTLGGEKRI